jgi:hypothetical protein
LHGEWPPAGQKRAQASSRGYAAAGPHLPAILRLDLLRIVMQS